MKLGPGDLYFNDMDLPIGKALSAVGQEGLLASSADSIHEGKVNLPICLTEDLVWYFSAEDMMPRKKKAPSKATFREASKAKAVKRTRRKKGKRAAQKQLVAIRASIVESYRQATSD